MKITKSEGQRREELAQKLETAMRDGLAASMARGRYIEQLSDARGDERAEILLKIRSASAAYERAVDAHESLGSKAIAFVARVAARLRRAYNSRTPKWRSSRAGVAADSIVRSWEVFSVGAGAFKSVGRLLRELPDASGE